MRGAVMIAVAVAVAVAGCGSDALPTTGASGMARDGSAVCVGDLGAPATATPCGSSSCPAGKICKITTPGIPPPPDAGDQWGYTYSCADIPAACACSAGCGPSPSAAGCFAQLCGGEPDCSFDGATLTCWGI